MTIPGIPWSAGEAAAINEFLNTPIGQKWLGVILTRKPKIDMSTTERAAISGAYAAGYESVFGEIAATRRTTVQPDAGLKSIDVSKD